MYTAALARRSRQGGGRGLTPAEHAQLLRELAEYPAEEAFNCRNDCGDYPPRPEQLAYAVEHESLASRARAAAEEIEARKTLTLEEVYELWLSDYWFNEGATFREFSSIVRLVLARFGDRGCE